MHLYLGEDFHWAGYLVLESIDSCTRSLAPRDRVATAGDGYLCGRFLRVNIWHTWLVKLFLSLCQFFGGQRDAQRIRFSFIRVWIFWAVSMDPILCRVYIGWRGGPGSGSWSTPKAATQSSTCGGSTAAGGGTGSRIPAEDPSSTGKLLCIL